MPTVPSRRVCTLFRERLTRALERRVYPRTMLHRKQLAGAIGVDGGTLDRWVRGHGSPSSEMTAALVQFFWSRGDRAFANEIFGLDVPPASPPSAPVAAALAALDQARQALLEGAAA